MAMLYYVTRHTFICRIAIEIVIEVDVGIDKVFSTESIIYLASAS